MLRRFSRSGALAALLLTLASLQDAAVGEGGLTPLHEAVLAGKPEAVTALLQAGAAVDATDATGQTPLHWAASRGDQPIVKLLLAKGAKIDAQDQQGQTPLAWALAQRDAATASLLLKAGANINHAGRGGRTLLHAAVERGDKAALALLLADGAAPGTKDDAGKTPFDLALEQNDAEAVAQLFTAAKGRVDQGSLWAWLAKSEQSALARKLVAEGLDPNAHPQVGRTLIDEAVARGDKNSVELLLACGGRLETPVAGAKTALETAFDRDDLPMLGLLLVHGADVNLPTRDGSLLEKAIYRRDEQVLGILLEHGASVTAADQYGLTALHAAAQQALPALAETLLAHGAPLESRTKTGQTPLMVAAAQGVSETLALLLAKGAQVEARDEKGETPLMLAAESGKGDVAGQLLAKGAEVNATDEGGMTALQFALRWSHAGVAAALLRAGADPNAHGGWMKSPPLLDAVRNNQLELAATLLAEGADINGRDVNGWTALLAAARYEQLAGLKFLLGRHASVAIQTNQGGTLLDLAADSDNPEVLGYVLEQTRDQFSDDEFNHCLYSAAESGAAKSVADLLRRGADFNFSHRLGKTPLHAAVYNGQNTAVARALLVAGARLDARDKEGMTPLHIAVQENRIAFVTLFLQSGAPLTVKDTAGRTPLALASELKRDKIAALLRTGDAPRPAATGALSVPVRAY